MMRSVVLPAIFSLAISLYLLKGVDCLAASRFRVNASEGNGVSHKRKQPAATASKGLYRGHKWDNVQSNASRNTCSRRRSLGSIALIAVSPLLSTPSASSAAGFPFESGLSTNSDTSNDPFRYDLSRTNAFLKLPRERALTTAEKEIRSIQDLEDDRLRECEGRGQFWEQCFIYGMRDDEIKGTRGPVDYQMVAPEAALEPAKVGKGSKTQIPTW